jgi:hypothetical protein
LFVHDSDLKGLRDSRGPLRGARSASPSFSPGVVFSLDDRDLVFQDFFGRRGAAFGGGALRQRFFLLVVLP